MEDNIKILLQKNDELKQGKIEISAQESSEEPEENIDDFIPTDPDEDYHEDNEEETK